MIGTGAIAVRSIALSRWQFVAAAVTFAVTVAGGGASLALLAKGAAFGVASAGGGASLAGLVKSTAFSISAAGGGSVLVGFQVVTINLFAIDLPGSRIIDGPGAVPGIAAQPVTSITIKPVRSIS